MFPLKCEFLNSIFCFNPGEFIGSKEDILSLQAEERLALSFYLAAHLPDCYDIYENVQF